MGAFGVQLPLKYFLAEVHDIALSLANVVDFIVGDTPQQGTLLEYVQYSATNWLFILAS